MSDVEVWKYVVGYEGIYRVSSYGDVYSFKSSRLLKQSVDKDGYKKVALSRSGKTNLCSVHRVMAIAFFGSAEGLVVDHLNSIKDDNRIENIELVSIRENTLRGKTKKTSKYRGVSYNKRSKKWCSEISFSGRSYFIGSYSCEKDAGEYYLKICNNPEEFFISMTNERNEIVKKNKFSKYTGVYKSLNKFRSCIYLGGKRINVGTFDTEEEAYQACVEAKNAL